MPEWLAVVSTLLIVAAVLWVFASMIGWAFSGDLFEGVAVGTVLVVGLAALAGLVLGAVWLTGVVWESVP